MPEIIIIGCPRSGLRFIADTFSQAGLDIKHEQRGADGIASWKMTDRALPKDAIVLHQIRDHHDTIGSMQTLLAASWDRLMQATSAKENQDLLERGMRVYLDWNRLAADKAVYSYRVEDIDSEWETISSLAGIPGVPLPDVGKEKNSRKDKYDPVSSVDLEAINPELSVEVAMYYLMLGALIDDWIIRDY